MDLIGPGCALIESLPLERPMLFLSALGHGAIAGCLAAAVIAYGIVRGDARIRRLGIAALVAVVVSGIAANALKIAFELPRPNPRHSSYGFPSGHTSTVFALAGVLGWAFPVAAPLLHLLALLTGVARLYLRAHFAVDVVGGAAVGSLTALGVGWMLLPTTGRFPSWARPLWVLPAAAAVLPLAFFLSYDQVLIAERPEAVPPAPVGAAPIAIALGTAAGRPFLVSGWSPIDERSEDNLPFVWAEGHEAVVQLPPLEPEGHRLRLRLQPFVARQGLSCQRVEVAVDHVTTGRLLLDRGWHDYELAIPRDLLTAGPAQVRFRFAYAGPGKGGDARAEARPLSVAFGLLEVLAATRQH